MNFLNLKVKKLSVGIIVFELVKAADSHNFSQN